MPETKKSAPKKEAPAEEVALKEKKPKAEKAPMEAPAKEEPNKEEVAPVVEPEVKPEEAKPGLKVTEVTLEKKGKKKDKKVKVEVVRDNKPHKPLSFANVLSIFAFIITLFVFFVVIPIPVLLGLPSFVTSTIGLVFKLLNNPELESAARTLAIVGLSVSGAELFMLVLSEILLAICDGLQKRSIAEDRFPFTAFNKINKVFVVIGTVLVTIALVLISVGFVMSVISLILMFAI